MDCGVPFCNSACPLGNLIPDWNDLARVGDWKGAIEQLHATNNFPEFTGLICPAPCESACVLDIDDDPVMIKQIEYWTIDNAFEEGWVVPRPPSTQDRASKVAVIGSGPAGLAAADELNKVGHKVTVYEKDEAVGGLLRFGVPDAKLEKWMIDRRVDILEQEGIEFVCDVEVGVDISVESLRGDFDAVVIAVGSRVERDLEIAGRELDGVHFAMEYLYQRNRWVAASQGKPRPRAGEGDHRRRQARRRDRRRRHRHGLRQQRAARGRRGRAPARRLPRGSRGRPLPEHALADPAAPADHHLRARRGRRARASAARCSASRATTAPSSACSPARSPATPRGRSSASRAASSRSTPSSS